MVKTFPQRLSLLHLYLTVFDCVLLFCNSKQFYAAVIDVRAPQATRSVYLGQQNNAAKLLRMRFVQAFPVSTTTLNRLFKNGG